MSWVRAFVAAVAALAVARVAVLVAEGVRLRGLLAGMG